MAADITKVKLGTCSVTFNAIDLGHTEGGVEVTYEPTWTDRKVDKYGDTVVEKILTGEKVTAKVPLAEYTVNNLLIAMPGGKKNGTTATNVSVGRVAGTIKGSALASILVLHPVNEATTDFDVKLYKAMVADQVTVGFKNDADRVLEITFTALLDESKADGGYLAEFGNGTPV